MASCLIVAFSGVPPMLRMRAAFTAVMIIGRFLSQVGHVGVYAYTPEAYPTRLRFTAVGTGIMWEGIGAVAGPALAVLVYERLGLSGVGVTIMVASITSVVFMLLTPKDRKGKDLC